MQPKTAVTSLMLHKGQVLLRLSDRPTDDSSATHGASQPHGDAQTDLALPATSGCMGWQLPSPWVLQ